MTITQRLLELDPSLKEYNEGQWGSDNPHSIGFHSFNDAGIECETGEFLYGLVRILQPNNILETGTHWGIGAAYMGMGLLDNGKGKLDTLEFLPEIHMRAQQRINTMALDHIVHCHFGDARAFIPEERGLTNVGTDLEKEYVTKKMYDLILLDTEPQTRFEELERYYDNLNEGGFVFIHDLHRHMHQIPNEEHGFAWPFGEVTEFMKNKVKEGKLRPFHFSTPRGFTGFYKVSNDDYKWEVKTENAK